MNPSKLAVLAVASASAIVKRGTVPAFDYENKKVRGVNLGGWFVLEPYMNPSMFEAFDPSNIPLDEYHYTEQLGKDEAFKRLDEHWNTWISEGDFKQLSDWGFNTVRIPIGYWAFVERPQDPYVQGQTKYLDRALEWARQYNISAWIDVHGVPGGQNGFDNSGIRDTLYWQSEEFPENMWDSYAAVDKVVEMYGGDEWVDVVSGIQPVNEPLGTVLSVDKLHDYYDQSYDKVRSASQGQALVVHDGFLEVGSYNEWLNVPDAYNIVVDHHRYQVFSPEELERSLDEHIEFACKTGTEIKNGENKWRVVGEWSAALTDCAKWLNGVYRGARYDATFQNENYLGTCQNNDDVGTWSEERKQNTRRYVEAQLDAWEHAGNGWIFWGYKTESTVEWDLAKLMNNGMFPYPLDSRQYPNQCGY